MNRPSRAETFAEIFREEALAHRARGQVDRQESPPLSALRLQGSLWVLIGAVAAALFVSARLKIGDHVSGPAVVRVGAATIQSEGGRTDLGAPMGGEEPPTSCMVVGSLPASRVESIQAGSRARFKAEPGQIAGPTPSGRPGESITGSGDADETSPLTDIPLLIERVGSITAPRVSKQDPEPPQDATVLVVGRFDPTEASLEGRARGCLEGAKGRLEVELPPRRLLSLLLPESLLRSESFR